MGTTRTRSSEAQRRTSATSSAVRGRTTASTEASVRSAAGRSSARPCASTGSTSRMLMPALPEAAPIPTAARPSPPQRASCRATREGHGIRPFEGRRLRGEHLPRIEEARGVERGPHPGHRLELHLAVDEPHVPSFVDADSVLTRDRAPRPHAECHDLLRRLLDALELVRIVAVEDDVRVEVPVTRMEDVRDLEAMTAADLRNPRQDLRQAGPRDRRVLYQQVGCDPPHGAEGLLAT